MTKIGTFIVNDPALSKRECLDIIKNTGFEAVNVGFDTLLNNDGTGVDPEIAGKLGLELESVHLTGSRTNYIWTDSIDGDDIAERYCTEIGLCAERGVKTGVAHVTWGIAAPPPVSRIGLGRFMKMAECAQKHEFRLALENSVSPEHLRYVLDRIDSEYIGFCYDSGHHNCFAPQEDYLGDYGDRLFAMHLQDNDGQRDLHLIPSDGCAPWPDIIGKLRKTRLYKTSITFEVGGRIHRECPGQPASQIARDLERISVIGDPSIVDIRDGVFDIYKNFSYEQYLSRLFAVGLKFAGRE